MSLYDFHVHSTYSDGKYSPQGIVNLAKSRGLKGLALTDHDKVTGVGEITKIAKKEKITIIPGVEISTNHMGHRLDILGYGIDQSDPKLLNRLNQQQESRKQRNRKQIEKLIELGFKIDLEKVKREESTPGGLCTPKLVEIILENETNLKKITLPTLKGVFNEHLKNGRPAYVPITKFDSLDAIKLIHECGGIASFAHPAESVENFEDLEKIIRNFAASGLEGLEIYSPKHDVNHVIFLKKMASELGLITTFGSDFHGKDDMHADLGSLEIPNEDEIVQKFLDKLQVSC